jgi:hypothetical protein
MALAPAINAPRTRLNTYGLADPAGASPSGRPHHHADRLDRSNGCPEPTEMPELKL